ncbi:DUF6393 family protein [Stenotrophomonas ginsengisoli]|uniref:DUF6393 family protein n=1 Tax=Stenotrophomonas ginsengisoli TaxID=336566 RepID=UPI001FDFD28E|nr:DUF6393 family protein [Stenotrophomonas ginsengisoli]
MTISTFSPIHQLGLTGILSLVLSLTACAGHDAAAKDQNIVETNLIQGVQNMFDEIYESGTPVRFEQIDVSNFVLSHLPLGTPRENIEQIFNSIKSSKTVASTKDTLVVRDNRGQAMLDPDARSVVITFSFDQNKNLQSIEAVHMKNQ